LHPPSKTSFFAHNVKPPLSFLIAVVFYFLMSTFKHACSAFSLIKKKLISLFAEDSHFFIEIKILRSKMKSRSHDRKKLFFA